MSKVVCDICGPKKHRRTDEEIKKFEVQIMCYECLMYQTVGFNFLQAYIDRIDKTDKTKQSPLV